MHRRMPPRDTHIRESHVGLVAATQFKQFLLRQTDHMHALEEDEFI